MMLTTWCVRPAVFFERVTFKSEISAIIRILETEIIKAILSPLSILPSPPLLSHGIWICFSLDVSCVCPNMNSIFYISGLVCNLILNLEEHIISFSIH